MRVGICDDDPESVKAAENIIQSFAIERNDVVLFRFDSVDTVVDDIISNGVEVLLLDIDMPGRDGIAIGDALAQRDASLNIIFFTNKDDMVFRAIYCHPFRFVRKSHMQTELMEALTSVYRKLSEEQMIICFEDKHDSIRLQIRDISYIESYRHYINIHTGQMVHTIRGKLSAYEERLSGLGFIRIHIGYLVNIRYIYRMTADVVQLDDGTELTVSRKYSQTARDSYNRGIERYVNGIIV